MGNQESNSLMQYVFPMGTNGTAAFGLGEDGKLVLTASVGDQQQELRFLDAVMTGVRGGISQAENMRVKDTLGAQSRYTVDGNSLLAQTRIDDVTVWNRFTVSTQVCAVTLEAWVETETLCYDCAIISGKTALDMTGFTQISGGEIPAVFPVQPAPPNYAFRDKLCLQGAQRYLQIQGGYVWYRGSTIEAHRYSDLYNDDLSWFGAENPLRTVYSFAPDGDPKPACAALAEPAQETGRLVSGELEIPFYMGSNGGWFTGCGTPVPMAAMLIRRLSDGKERWLDTRAGWRDAAAEIRPDGATFQFLGAEGCPDTVGLRLEARFLSADNRIAWTVEVVNPDPDTSVLWCSYPRFSDAPAGAWDLFIPRHGGYVEPGFNLGERYEAGSYPSGLSFSMAYLAFYPAGGGKGLYYAIHDGGGGYKDFALNCDGRGRVRLDCKFCAPYLGEPANGFRLPGEAVWQQFEGDWFDATEIYRAYLESDCDWLPELAENGRENIPLWMRDLPFWVMDWLPIETDAEEPIPVSIRPSGSDTDPDSWFKTPIRLREALGVPIGFHIYNWHRIPFNNDYPHYFPVKKAFPRGLAALKAADIRVMPYINALLWDTKDRENTDYQYSAVAKQGAVKKENGEVPVQTYASHESDGKLVQLAPMCPSAPVWRQKLVEVVGRLFGEYGMDAVYLDQIAAHRPYPCMDKTHSHAPGGGSWWAKEYRELLRALHAVKGPENAFTSEGNAEVYASELDGFLGWAWICVEQYVPAFMRLYGGRTVCFGRNANGYMKANTTYWKYHLAQALVAGEQMGWINSDFVDDPERLAFARKLVQLRYRNREFFRGARPMRPPAVEAEASHKFACGLGMGSPGVLYRPYLCVGVLENGRKRKLIAVNLSTEAISDNIRFVPQELRLSGCTQSGEGSAEPVGEDRLHLCIPGNGVMTISWEV